MRSGPFEPDRREGDVLLLGDSLVFGGNPLDQTETWGAQLEAAMGGSVSVWAMGAPSWSSANEVVWLRRHDEILPKMEAVVWVLNSGDFFGRSQWSSSLDHPLASPWSHAVWAVLKYGMPRIYPQWRRPAVVHDAVFANEGVVRAYWREFLGQMSREKPHLRWCFVLYPNQYELARTESAPVWKVWCDGVKGLVAESGLKGWVEVLGEREGWRPEYYRDFIHPNAEGNRVLANKTSEWLRDTMEDK
jgi:lysophospholipase L1-like esterase